MAIRYHITLPNPDTARGSDPAFAFRAHGAAALAAELQDALRTERCSSAGSAHRKIRTMSIRNWVRRIRLRPSRARSTTCTST